MYASTLRTVFLPACLIAASLAAFAAGPSGTAVAPPGSADSSIVVSPGYLWFGDIQVNEISSYQTETLTNSGGSTLNIGSIQMISDLFDAFGIRNQTCGATLGSGSSCSFDVVFRPTAAGYAQSQVSITDNFSGSPQQFYVAGEGETGPKLSFSSTSLAFPPTSVGNTAAYQQVTITNVASNEVKLSSIAITDTTNPYSWGIRENTCGPTLLLEHFCTFSVAFRPTTTGPLTADVTIKDNAGQPTKITLAGTGKE